MSAGLWVALHCKQGRTLRQCVDESRVFIPKSRVIAADRVNLPANDIPFEVLMKPLAFAE